MKTWALTFVCPKAVTNLSLYSPLTKKNWRSHNCDFLFSWKENLKKCCGFEEQKVQSIFGEMFILAFCLQLSFVFKTLSQIPFNLLCSGDKRVLPGKRLLSGSEMMISETKWTQIPQIFWLKIKIKETETQFCRWKSNNNNNIKIFLSLENPCAFLLVKEKTWKCIFNELSQNCTESYLLVVPKLGNFPECFNFGISIFQMVQIKVKKSHSGAGEMPMIYMLS